MEEKCYTKKTRSNDFMSRNISFRLPIFENMLNFSKLRIYHCWCIGCIGLIFLSFFASSVLFLVLFGCFAFRCRIDEVIVN